MVRSKAVRDVIIQEEKANDLLVTASQQQKATTLIQSYYRGRLQKRRLLSLQSCDNREFQLDAAEGIGKGNEEECAQQQRTEILEKEMLRIFVQEENYRRNLTVLHAGHC